MKRGFRIFSLLMIMILMTSFICPAFASTVRRTEVYTTVNYKAVVFFFDDNSTYELEPIFDDSMPQETAVLGPGDVIFFYLVASGEYVDFNNEEYSKKFGIAGFWISIYFIDEKTGEIIESMLDDYFIYNYSYTVLKIRDSFAKGFYKVKIAAQTDSSSLYSTTVGVTDVKNEASFVFKID